MAALKQRWVSEGVYVLNIWHPLNWVWLTEGVQSEATHITLISAQLLHHQPWPGLIPFWRYI